MKSPLIASLRLDHKDLKHKHKHVIRIDEKAERENSTQLRSHHWLLLYALISDHKDLKHKHKHVIRIVEKAEKDQNS